ncbi:putative ribosomal N-acetyltransferase YdaF [Clostridium acetireducens DSM 10703]|uniref:Putative ribosomal N-acetyltransferase YdaF n=1 Tax=Clostridium acetireducens DSM 10703 TaxID=1121290 RepID=A0A1E8EWS2_9CLOT|nr:GNAT family protein [Clostridium acetireducens]OFI05062.1 putative ribosomal N-acetyltransferase YdaF [Clostridium acetireducens DSM 10703]
MIDEKEFPVIETKRLVLDRITTENQYTLFKYWSDEIVTKYMNIVPIKTIDEVKSMISFFNELFYKNEAVRWGIFRKEDNLLIGTCGFNSGLQEDSFIGRIGCDLYHEFWGKGFMKEALQNLIDYGFENFGVTRIEAYAMKENVNSERLLNKLGFTREGLLREHGIYKGELHDEYIFSVLKKEWK